MYKKKMNLCRCHPDFHIPEDAVVGENFDGVAYAAKVKETGADSLVFFGKCHYGFSYYPTKIGTVHPGLQKDMLAEFVKGCRKVGLGVTCYYSLMLDTDAVSKHPDWGLVANSGEPVKGNYLPLCVNSPYVDERLLPQAMEIIENYDIDELFYDTMSNFTPCYCDNCRRMFGKPIPVDSGDPDWLEYVRWYYEQYADMFAKVARIVHEKKPNVSVIFNWSWSARQPDAPPPHIQQLIGDLYTSGQTASYFSHYWAGTEYPFDYMCGRFLHGLGDWSSSTPETLKYVSASTIANGGGFYLIDRQLPDGSMEDRSYVILKDVFDFVQERREVVEGTKHVPETAVLHPFEHIQGPELQYFPDSKLRAKRSLQLFGAARMFMKHSRHYTALNSENLGKRISEYKLIVLPELEHLDGDIKNKMKAFVENGGKLLIAQSGDPDKLDVDILELAGVECEGFTELEYAYIENNSQGFSDPVLVRGKFAQVKPKPGTEIIARMIMPLVAGKGGSKFGHGFAPAHSLSGYAAIVRRKLGKGEVIYAAGPLFSSYESYMNPHIAKLVLKLYDHLMPAPLVKVHTSPLVEMTAVRKADDFIVHLVNQSGNEILSNGWLRITEHIPELFNISLSIKDSGKSCKVISEPDGNVMETWTEDGYINFKVPSLQIMRSFQLKDYFKTVE